MIRQFIIDWSGPGSSGGMTVIHSNVTGAATSFASDVNGALTAWEALADPSASAQLRSEYKEIDEMTGEMQAVDTIPVQGEHTGSLAGEPVANASMGLLQFFTAGIVAGRRVRGRIFVPFISQTLTEDGEWAPPAIASLSDMAGQFESFGRMTIWSRPKTDSEGTVVRPGSSHTVTGHGAWSEIAVQRRRRD